MKENLASNNGFPIVNYFQATKYHYKNFILRVLNIPIATKQILTFLLYCDKATRESDNLK